MDGVVLILWQRRSCHVGWMDLIVLKAVQSRCVISGVVVPTVQENVGIASCRTLRVVHAVGVVAYGRFGRTMSTNV